MTVNELSEGIHRLGWFIDGDPDTPHVAVSLEDNGQGIVLTIPTLDLGPHEGPYSRWGTRGIVMYGDDPDRTRHSYEPPEVCQFVDVAGPVVLVGCRAIENVQGDSAGRVKVSADYAVIGARHLRYSTINGLRSTMPALASWSQLRSVSSEPITDDRSRVQRIDVRLESPPNVPLSRRMNLTLRPTWRTAYPDTEGTFAAHDVVQLMTATKRPRSWEEHLAPHLAVRELLAISGWEPFGFTRLDVNRGDDPERVLSGEAVGVRWAQVHTHRLPKHTPWSSTPRFLFYLEEIGPHGVDRWLRLRQHFDRALRPLLAIVDRRITTLDTAVVSSGILLEAIGYQLAVDAGEVSPGKKSDLYFRDALQFVLDDMVYSPLRDPADWKDRTNAHYKGVKHADNVEPRNEDLQDSVRQCVSVGRYWIAGRLGVPATVLADRHQSDPLARHTLR